MQLIAIARHGIGVAGPIPAAIALARTVALELVRCAEPRSLAVQAAGPPAELEWLARLPGLVRAAPLPPGVAFAVRVANGDSPLGAVLAGERVEALGPRLAAVLGLGAEAVLLDRRDGSAPLRLAPEFTSRATAARWARERAVAS